MEIGGDDFNFFKSANFLTDFHQRLLSSMFDKIGGYQRFFFIFFLESPISFHV